MSGRETPAEGSRPTSSGLVPRPLTEEERKEAWTTANFYNAESGHEQPVALWVLGPSSVGKSTLTAQIAPKFGIRKMELPSDAGTKGLDMQRSLLDAVVIDGEFVRDAHDVWQRWVKLPDWRSAYPALKSIINKEKDAMCTEAAALRKNLVIPQTMLNLRKGLTEIDELAIHGYINHIVAVVAPLEECQRRGSQREQETGKRYQPKEFEQSIAAIPQMISVCNGRYELVKAIEREDPKLGMRFESLAEGHGGLYRSEEGEVTGISESDIGVFAGIISVAIGKPRSEKPELLRMPSKEVLPDIQGFPLPSSRPCDVRPFTDSEREVAWCKANAYRCASGHAKPIALWVLGPGAVGKSKMTIKLGSAFDIPMIEEALTEGQDPRCQLNAVIVDGDLMRASYEVYHSWANSTEKQYAYRAVKSVTNKEKSRLMTDSISQRKHMVIPQRMLDLNKGLTEVEELTRYGFVNHVAAVVAPLEQCQRAADKVNDATGKFDRSIFEADYAQSISAIEPMIQKCNGRYQIIRVTESKAGLEFTKVAEDACGGNDEDESAVARSKTYYDYLRKAIDAAISS